ncbi:glycogenin-2-like isoform X1 [Sitophilus oryzae]|uniref:glycogenin glucosyltransferase n=1 Tax=Sitophilus oryzae TaxID=7048 RepID=A0A6J2XC88_SITOR|nr:glycogenin-2-like isoform X1 [Sitophilus oryzae]
MGGFAWVTLATNDSYSLGALVLAHSLKQAGTVHQLAVLVTPGVTSAMREKLTSVFNLVQEVNILDSKDEANLRLLKRPELGVTFTKLHCWRLTQYEKCVFLDADTLVLQNADELFEREEFSAAPDVGWPDCFNSGVFVYRPSIDTYEKLIAFALEKGSFDGGDQGLLNLFFSDWAYKDISKHLPFIYNLCSTACYSYLPAYKQFGANAKIVHFIGATKPWLQYFNTETKTVQPSGEASHLQDVLQRWWNIFCSLIHPQLSPAMPEAQSQYSVSQSYYPPHFVQPSHTISSAGDYDDAWDPWDEYDQKLARNVAQYQYTHSVNTSAHYNDQNQPIESLNTNASVAEPPTTHSQSQSYNTYSDQNTSYQPPPHPPLTVQSHHDRPPTPPPPSPQYHTHHSPLVHHIPESPHPQQHHHHHEQPPHPVHNEPHESRELVQIVIFHSHQTHSEFKVPSPERPRSPIHSVPILPKECEATTTVSNDISLSSNIEENTQEGDAGLAGAFAQLTLGVPRTQEQEAFDSLMRKQAWEVGNIDYLGRDSFENIWSKITQTLSAGAPEPAPPTPVVAPAESQSQSTALPQEEAKPDEPPVDISTAVDSLSLEPTESKSSVVTSLPAEEATPSVTETVPIETKSSPQESVQVIPKEAVIEPPQPATPQKETPLPVESVISSEKEAETVSQKEVEPVLEPAVVSPPVVEPPVIPQPTVEPSVVSQPVEVLQPAEQPPVVSGPTQKESEPTLPPSTLPESSPVIPQVVPKETEPLVTAQVVKEAEQSLAASQVAVAAPKESVPSSPLPEISTKESSKPVAKEPAPKAATPKEPQKGKPAEAPAAPVAEKPKQASVEAATTSEPASTPTPPPRKTDKPKKVASKPKK